MPDELDLTSVVNALGDTFVRWGGDYLYTQAIATPGLSWLALPVVSTVVRWVLDNALRRLSESTQMQAFFLNTAIRKSGEAQDYWNTVLNKIMIPNAASQEEYEKAEQDEMAAFDRLVRLAE